MNEIAQVTFSLYLIPFFRAFGVLILLPFGESVWMSLPARVIVAICMATLAGGIPFAEGSFLPLIVGRELGIGMVCAIPLSMVIAGAGIFGDLFDTSRGQNVATLYDPLHETQDSAVAVLAKNITWVHLLLLGVFERILVNYFDSFQKFSITSKVDLVQSAHTLLLFLGSSCSEIFLLFLPWATLFLLIELCLAFFARAIPNISLSSESFQLKSYLGFFLLSVFYSPNLFNSLFGLAAHPITIATVTIGL